MEMSVNKNSQVELTRINTKDLLPHPIAQRELDVKHGDRLAKYWNWDYFEPISVSYRDGKYWVIAGQHRLYAIKKRNGGKDCSVICRVFYGMTVVDECEFFLQDKNSGYVVSPQKLSTKMAVKYRIGDPDITGMVTGAEAAGWTVDFKSGDNRNRINAVGALLQCYKSLSYEQYVTMLKILKDAWGDDAKATHQMLMKGMTIVCKTYWQQFKPSEMAKSLSTVKPEAIIRDGKGLEITRGTSRGIMGGRPYARSILHRYNTGRKKNRLEDIL